MVQIICLIVGIVYALRKPKFRKLQASQFPGVSPGRFEEWRSMELESINIFLWVSWGIFSLELVFMFFLSSLAGDEPETAIVFQLAFGAIFLIGLAIAVVFGEKAKKLKKKMYAEAGKDFKGVKEIDLADPGKVNSPGKDGRTSLHWAAEMGFRDVVELLCANGANVNARDLQGKTPLTLALLNHHGDVAEFLRARCGEE